MASHGFPLLYVVLVWFVSTGAIIWLDGLPRATFRWSLAGASLVAAGGVAAVAAWADDTSATGAYVGFTAALAIWGWHEMSFLMGIVTGPRTLPLPVGTTGWQRFRLATATVIHHEVAMAATALGLLALTWGEANQTAAATFGVLFVMRLSTKLNIYLGVPNLTTDFLPPHLDYLKSYFRRRSFNPLFPVSVVASTLAALALGAAALDAPTDGATVALTMLWALVVLAVVEHWFLVLPLHDAALWRWAMSARAGQAK